MKLKEHFEVGQIVHDTLGDYECIVRSINQGNLTLSRLDRQDVKYYQVPRYIEYED